MVSEVIYVPRALALNIHNVLKLIGTIYIHYPLAKYQHLIHIITIGCSVCFASHASSITIYFISLISAPLRVAGVKYIRPRRYAIYRLHLLKLIGIIATSIYP